MTSKLVVRVSFILAVLFGLAPAPGNAATLHATMGQSAGLCGPVGWRVVPDATAAPHESALDDLAILAPDDVWAVGLSRNGSADRWQSLIEHWNGADWSTVPAAQDGANDVTLRAVAALGPHDIWAGGSHLQHWNGTRWTISPYSALAGATDAYSGISAMAAAANEIWAVNPYSATLHWNGAIWAADPGSHNGWAVDALNEDDVWIAGSDPLFQHWDGHAWTSYGADIPLEGATFMGVSARSTDDVWAVGYSVETIGRVFRFVPVSAHWDGAAWTIQPVPLAEGESLLMQDVVTVDGGQAWAVGFREGPSGAVIWHWDGSAWSIFPNPDDKPTGPLGSYLNGVEAGSGELWTVGAYYPSGSAQIAPFVEHYPDHLPTFADVESSSPFFAGIEDLACRGVISGYACASACDALERPYFRPLADTTRAQLTKIVVEAAGWKLQHPTNPTFDDVPPDNSFYPYIETAVAHGVVSGYAAGERRVFRPYNTVTRGQLAKIIAAAQGWPAANPAEPTFVDVTRENLYFAAIETAYAHGIISGYDLPNGDKEFRWGNNATRGQIAKIVSAAIAVPQNQSK